MKFLKNIRIDLVDILIFVGLLFIWYGAFLVSPPVSFIVVGSMLFALGLLGATRGGEK